MRQFQIHQPSHGNHILIKQPALKVMLSVWSPRRAVPEISWSAIVQQLRQAAIAELAETMSHSKWNLAGKQASNPEAQRYLAHSPHDMIVTSSNAPLVALRSLLQSSSLILFHYVSSWILLYLALSCHILLSPAMSCCILLYPVALCNFLLHPAKPCCILLPLLHRATSCYILSWNGCVLLCPATIISYYLASRNIL